MSITVERAVSSLQSFSLNHRVLHGTCIMQIPDAQKVTKFYIGPTPETCALENQFRYFYKAGTLEHSSR